MGNRFWLTRFLTVLTGAFIVITVVQLIKGHDRGFALSEGAFWGLIAAAVFTAARMVQSRRGQYCALCADTPDAVAGKRSPEQ